MNVDLVNLIFLPIQPFVGHPERVAIVAALFFIAYALAFVRARKVHRPRAWPLLVPALLWTLFVPWEAYCKAGSYNIRVDLLVIWPILAIATLGGIATTLASRTEVRKNSRRYAEEDR
jgi:hypothetical protein